MEINDLSIELPNIENCIPNPNNKSYDALNNQENYSYLSTTTKRPSYLKNTETKHFQNVRRINTLIKMNLKRLHIFPKEKNVHKLIDLNYSPVREFDYKQYTLNDIKEKSKKLIRSLNSRHKSSEPKINLKDFPKFPKWLNKLLEYNEERYSFEPVNCAHTGNCKFKKKKKKKKFFLKYVHKSFDSKIDPKYLIFNYRNDLIKFREKINKCDSVMNKMFNDMDSYMIKLPEIMSKNNANNN